MPEKDTDTVTVSRKEFPDRRTLRVAAYGNTVEELENWALLAGREVFGDSITIEVGKDYIVSLNTSPRSHPDKRYFADVGVREVVPPAVPKVVRESSMSSYGETFEEIEADAIRQAKEIFGEDAELIVVGTYTIQKTLAAGKPSKFATVTVRFVSAG